MRSGEPSEPSPDLLAAMEAELLELRALKTELIRERVAIAREREAMDAERASWARRPAAQEHDRDQPLSAAHARALRWSPRHRLGVLAHRYAVVRRLRAGGRQKGS